ncbi:hypothetical protein FRC02_008331 [Tulasnella sp. 418]|nr:hypothetical protein FRC02_008331 [Tulasnella sp. 418]
MSGQSRSRNTAGPSSNAPTPVILGISNVPEHASFQQVKAQFDKLLLRGGDRRIPYTLNLAQAAPGKKNGGAGTIQLSSLSDARFLQSRIQKPQFKIMGNVIYFAKMTGSLARAPQVHNSFIVPTIRPEALKKKKESLWNLRHRIRVCKVQFGVLGRNEDSLFIEWEGDYDPEMPNARNEEKPTAYLSFDDGREGDNPRSVQIEIGGHSDDFLRRITIPMQQIKSISSAYDFGQPFVHFVLHCPPSFEIRPQYMPSSGDEIKDKRQSWRRLRAFDTAHERVVPFASRSLRVVFTRDEDHLTNFMEMAKYVRLPRLKQSQAEYIYKSDLFGRKELQKFERLITSLPWVVGFQCEALLRNCLLHTSEIFALEKDIRRLLQVSVRHAAEVLRQYVILVGGVSMNKETITNCFKRAERECNERGSDESVVSWPLGTFECRHISVTPTSFMLEGPYPEQSNRVIRRYGDKFEEYFLRVAFADEGGMKYRFEFDVDTQEFIRERVGSVLKEGLIVAGRHFTFLAYSSSALREHSVWFVAPFEHPVYGYVDAETIRQSLGDFTKVIRTPARYGARLSQAFSSTDPTVAVLPEEICTIPDISVTTEVVFPNRVTRSITRDFTDGVGTISPELADEIWERLRAIRPSRSKEDVMKPSAYQIRMGGYKGMVCVDYTLKGRKICPRPSMNKFDAPESLDIEVAQAFEKPGPMYLNRPLIMLLETLGVRHHAFIALQDDAVESAQERLNTPESSALLLDLHGLGSAFRLPSLLPRLASYGLGQLHEKDPFFRRILMYTLFHVKRELKNHARIPVPDSWTLVGVADEYSVLEEDEIYACVSDKGKPSRWLEGYCMVSRSPTVHPGDVRMVRAIGEPKDPKYAVFEKIVNCVVFPTKGPRPIPSCLGGGDLDGDLYNLVLHSDLHPPVIDSPAEYFPEGDHDLGRESTIDDIADFVVEFINSDILGLIGINHLMLADQRPQGVRDDDCKALAELHSKAVDYNKTGKPVSNKKVKKPPMKPDWQAGELNDPGNGDFYESERALGVLYRRIQLEKPDELKAREPIPVGQAVKQQSVVENALNAKLLRYLVKADLRRDEPELIRLLARPHARLTEEELVVGTILEQTSQPARRRDMMTRLRQQSGDLVLYVKGVIHGDPGSGLTEEDYLLRWLARAWVALQVGYTKER